MDLIYVVLGGVFLVSGVGDLLWTTLSVSGSAGPLTSTLMSSVWRGLRNIGSRRSNVLALSGPAILMLTLAMWLLLIWAGWTFLFAGGGETLLDTRNTGPISWAERIYFTGYTLFTLGNGDFTPQGGLWQIATALATASGMLFVTLSVSYVLSVLDAVSQKRAFASNVTGLGLQGETILDTAWDGDEFDGFDLQLTTFTSQLNTLTANHKAYPILHYYYSKDSEQAAVISIVALDEALTLLTYGVSKEHQPSTSITTNARSSVQSYLDTLSGTFTQSGTDTPPLPDLQRLRDAGIQTVSNAEFSDSLADLHERRRKLHGLVESDAREWPSAEDT